MYVEEIIVLKHLVTICHYILYKWETLYGKIIFL